MQISLTLLAGQFIHHFDGDGSMGVSAAGPHFCGDPYCLHHLFRGGAMSQGLPGVAPDTITYLPGWGEARCYEVQGGGLYEECWMQIIRDHLGLGRMLKPAWSGSEKFYTHAYFMIHPGPDGSSWSLRQGDAPSENGF